MVRDSVGKISAAGLSGVVTDTVQEAGEGDPLKRRNWAKPNRSDSEKSWKNYSEVHTARSGKWWDAVWFHAKM